MANILVRGVPDDVHAKLQRKAQERHQSLQQYLLGELRRTAERTSAVDVFREIDQRQGGRVGLGQAVEDLAAERSQR